MHDPQDASEAYGRGLEYLDYNEPDQAIRAFSEALKLNPRHVHAYFARGCAWAERGNLEQALPTTTRSFVSIRTTPPPTATGPPCWLGAATPRPPPPISGAAGI